jgi:HEAT repeat protein
MFPLPARLAGVLALFAFTIGFALADDEPEFDGKKLSEWAKIVKEDPSARKRVVAVDALNAIWVANKTNLRGKDAITYINWALLNDASAPVRIRAVVVLGSLNKDDIALSSKTLVEALKKEKESRVRREIIAVTAKFPAVCVMALEPLEDSLKDTDPTVKVAAAEAIALCGMHAKSTAPELVPLLKDKEKSVRIAGVYALGRIAPDGASTIAETMAEMLGSEKDSDIKRQLVASIGLLAEKSEPVVKALAAALFDADDEIRRAAARVLGTFGPAASSAANSLLKVIVGDKVKDIRVDAVRAFGSALGPTGLKARLRDLHPRLDPLKEPDFEVRLAIVEEIGALGYDIHMDKDTLAVLRLRLSDPQLKVREAAGVAIRRIETKPMPKKDPDPKKNP